MSKNCSACPASPVKFFAKDSAADLTGVAPEDGTGVRDKKALLGRFSLEIFGDVMLNSDATKIPIVCKALKGNVGIPLVVLVIKGENKPSQELIVQSSSDICNSVSADDVNKSISVNIEKSLCPEPFKEPVPCIKARPPELVDSKDFGAEEVLIEAGLTQKRQGQALVTGREVSSAGKGFFILSAMCIADGIASIG